LISITEEGIKETELWEEGRVEIDLTNKVVNFDVLFSHTRDEYEAYYDDIAYEDIPIYDIKFEEIPFDDFTEFAKK
jgi:hypothetical protein